MTAHRRSFAPTRASKRQGERGQILPMTAIALVAISAVAADMGYFFDYGRPIKKVALAE
ncbi:MAG TPA: hypothetical protein VGA81_04980 [Methylomirabilota bacterium]